MIYKFACTICKKLMTKEVCEDCNQKTGTKKWSGIFVCIDPELSQIANKKNIKKKGIYSITADED